MDQTYRFHARHILQIVLLKILLTVLLPQLRSYMNYEEPLSNREIQHKFNNLVLEGDGIRTISHIGMLLMLQETSYYDRNVYTFESIESSSTGCFMAFLVSLDIPPERIEQLFLQVDVFKTLTDQQNAFDESFIQLRTSNESGWYDTIQKSTSLLAKAQKLINLWLEKESPGLTSITTLQDFIVEHIIDLSPYRELFSHNQNQPIIHIQNLTFQQLHEITKHKLVCMATRMSDRQPIEFSVRNTPNYPVLDAIYGSMTVPGLFKPLNDGYNKPIVDGSLSIVKFPINVQPHTLYVSLNSRPNNPHLPRIYKSKRIQRQSEDQKYAKLDTLELFTMIYETLTIRTEMFAKNDDVINRLANKNRIIFLASPLNTFDTHNLNIQLVSEAISKAFIRTRWFFGTSPSKNTILGNVQNEK